MDVRGDGTDDHAQEPRNGYGFRMWYVIHAWQRQVEAALQPLGVTYMQLIMLGAVDHLVEQGSSVSQTRLAVFLKWDRMMVSKIVRLLEGKNLLTRERRRDDSRANQVQLTAEGRDALEAGRPIATDQQARFFGRLGPEKLALFRTLLDELLINPTDLLR